MQVILASTSPQRLKLLQSLGLDIITINPKVHEQALEGETPESMVIRLAELKANLSAEDIYLALKEYQIANAPKPPITELLAQIPIIGADTTVCLHNLIFEKPKDKDDAIRMLTLLSGKEHQVITGYSVKTLNRIHSRYVTTKVSFRSLTEKEIIDYVNSGEPMNKAGSYAVQGLAGNFIDQINGSFTNIIGLPLPEVYADLKNALK